MSLRSRVAVLLVALSVALAGIMYAAQEWVVMPTFRELERTAAEKNVNRCVEALHRDLESLANMTNDWALWDDSYRYVQDRNSQFEATSLADETFANANLDLICYLDLAREIVWGEVRGDRMLQVSELPELLAVLRDPLNPLMASGVSSDQGVGLLATSEGPLLLAARPILSTKREGPSRGTLVMGRFFDAAEVADLAARTQIKLRAWVVGADPLPPRIAEALQNADDVDATRLEVAGPDLLYAYHVIQGIDGKPSLIIQLEMPRDVTQHGQSAAQFATACMIIASAIIVGVVWSVLQNGVVTPLRQMAVHASQLGRNGDLRPPLQFRRRDEIGTLAGAFDGMVDRIRHIAFHDSLTDLPNRTYLMERLRSCFERSRRDCNYRFGLLFVDVDNFKLINDSLGHRVGDQLLTHVAISMRDVVHAVELSVRHSRDLVARLGGDEFVVLLDDIDGVESMLAVARRIQQQACAAVHFDNRRITPGLSIGAAISSPSYEDGADVLRDADTALYHAKAEGKACIAVFDQVMRSEVLERANLEADLQRAVAQHEFDVHFQPIVALETGRLACLEALVRWQHPTRGLLAPDEFIRVAEENGLIEPIGEQVLEQVCRQMAQWDAAGSRLGGIPVSVNVAARQFAGHRLPELIDDCLERYGLAATQLKIELTETTAIGAVAHSRCVFKALASRGIEIYLDDFGSGHSSLSALHSLPFAAIKLDRGFVKNLETEPENEATVRAMVMIAESRQLRLIAEGIETCEQLATLRSLDCRYGQGFYFSRPLPAGELEATLGSELQFVVDASTS